MLISHKEHAEFDLQHFIEKAHKDSESSSISVEEKIALIKALSEFPLGRFLLSNQGLNGYWTAYVILHGIHQNHLSELESWLLFKAPGMKATRERFHIFQQQVQKRLADNMKLASVPCGLMDDLLTLDYKSVTNVQLTGIDIDEASLDAAFKNAQMHKIDFASFLQKDAWNLDLKNEFDVLVSNGLNIYEPSQERLLMLYQQFYQAIKPGGCFITSFITPPPSISAQSPWKNVNMEEALKQQIIFAEVLNVNWRYYQLEDDVRATLNAAGFKVLQVIYDEQGIFPTIIAEK